MSKTFSSCTADESNTAVAPVIVVAAGIVTVAAASDGDVRAPRSPSPSHLLKTLILEGVK